jgi:phosphoesterase RecJ-like protein
VVGDEQLPDTLQFLSGAETLVAPDQIDITQTDLLVTVDCADEMRVGPIYDNHPEWFDGRLPLINIDHHITNTRFGTTNLIDPDAAATCELLTLLFLTNGIKLDAKLATCLMAGVLGDTLGLRTPSTTSRTLRVSAELLDAGADLDTVVDHLFRVKPFSTVALWGLALSRAERVGDLVWTEITPEMLAESEAVAAEGEGIVNFLAGTMGARVGALLYQQADNWRVSLRSVREDVDVAALARLYGGGGHSRAAGCRLEPGAESRDRFLQGIASRVAAIPVTTP